MPEGILATKMEPGRPWRMDLVEDVTANLRPEPLNDILLIVGDARHVLYDLQLFLEFGVLFDTMCINYSAKLIPWPIQHFVAGDGHMPDMQAVANELPDGVRKHCWNPSCPGFDIRWIKSGRRDGWEGFRIC